MYYAACCCEGPPPACNCDGGVYASVGFALSFFGGIGPIVEDECDRLCDRNRGEAYHDLQRYYVEGKVYMKCGGSAIDTYYSTGALPDFRQTFDGENLVILHQHNYMNFRIYERVRVPNCCDPPYDDECWSPDGPGLRYFLDSRYCTLDAFDPYDLAFPETIIMNAFTYVYPGGAMTNAIPLNLREATGLELDTDRWYRRTKVTATWSLPGFGSTYLRDWDGTIESETGPCGDPGLPWQTRLGATKSIVRLADVGEYCDPQNPGAEVITYTEAQDPQNVMQGYEVPYSNVVVDTSTTTCAEQVEGLDCCDDADVTIPEGQTITNYSIGSETDGGIFSLEFSDDPPPELP